MCPCTATQLRTCDAAPHSVGMTLEMQWGDGNDCKRFKKSVSWYEHEGKGEVGKSGKGEVSKEGAPSDWTRPIGALSDWTRPIGAPSDWTRPIGAPSDWTRPIRAPSDWTGPDWWSQGDWA